MGQPNAFVHPFLDAAKITKDTTMTLKSGEHCTTAEWEEFIAQAQEEWEDLQLRRLENIQKSLGDNKQDNNNDSTLLWEGDLMLKNPSGVWNLTSPPQGIPNHPEGRE